MKKIRETLSWVRFVDRLVWETQPVILDGNIVTWNLSIPAKREGLRVDYGRSGPLSRSKYPYKDCRIRLGRSAGYTLRNPITHHNQATPTTIALQQ